MPKKIFGIYICLLMLSSVGSSISITEVGEYTLKPIHRGKTLYVGGQGPYNYSTIRDALGDAKDGDTVYVYDDSSPYYENVVIGNKKNISLIGEDKFTTVIDGQKKRYWDVVLINGGEYNTVSGFTIQYSGDKWMDAGIEIYRSNNNTIKNNIITLNEDEGICLYYANGNTISGNIITENHGDWYHGVYSLSSNNNIFIDNNISRNGYGFSMHSSHNNIFKNNTINDNHNEEGNFGCGIYFDNCHYCIIVHNNISNNSGDGLSYYKSDSNKIYYNSFVGNGWGYIPGTEGAAGIYIRAGSDANYVRGNIVKRNKMAGIKIFDCNKNIVRENNISDNYKEGIKNGYSRQHIFYNRIGNNSINGFDRSSKQNWYLNYPYGGNYWEDYSGEDKYRGKRQNITGSDGLGDKPYNISGEGKNKDKYPLIYPLGKNPPYADFNYKICTYNVTFNAQSSIDRDGVIINYSWNFGDGNSGTGNFTTHTYLKSGKYDVTLNVTDDDGKTDEISQTVKVPIVNTPPNPPKNHYPANGSNISKLRINMSWECTDPDGDLHTYFVYLDANDSTPDILVAETQKPFYITDILNINTTYYWQIVAWDICNFSFSPIWHFIMRNNSPPSKPKNPQPPNNATNVSENPMLRWRCSDPEGDNMTFNVYFEENDTTPDVLISENQTYKWIKIDNLNYSTLYYWKIVAWDEYGLSTSGPIWKFTTTSVPNDPPYKPSDPTPKNGSVNIGIDTMLKWTGGDPDPDDSVVYDVYLEANDPTPDILVSGNQSENTYDPSDLEQDTRYYWMIIARDNHYAETNGPVWHFTTSKSDLDCDGSLSWTRVSPGSTVTGTFTVSNIGESRSLLDWGIDSYPDWGTWTFDPESGEDLTPEDEPVMVNVSVVAPDKKNSEFTGEVKIINIWNESDNITIPAYLQTPKNKFFFYNFPLLNRLINMFSNAFPILRYILRLNLL